MKGDALLITGNLLRYSVRSAIAVIVAPIYPNDAIFIQCRQFLVDVSSSLYIVESKFAMSQNI